MLYAATTTAPPITRQPTPNRQSIHLPSIFNHQGTNEQEYGNNEEEEDELANQEKRHRASKYLSIALCLLFYAFIIYALVQVGKEDEYKFEARCGSEGKAFYHWMIARFVLGFIQFVPVAMSWLSLRNILNGPEMSPKVYLMAFLFFAAYATYLALGIYYTRGAMDKQDCRNAMSDSSFTKTPLLGILGWVYVAIDAMAVFLIVGLWTFWTCAGDDYTQI